MVLPALNRGGYRVSAQVHIGRRLGLRKHVVDLVAERASARFLISLKWQQVSGTAEQKVPFELICLLDAILNGAAQKAYLVLGGEGWTLRDFYTSGGLAPYIDYRQAVELMTLEAFAARANAGEL